MPIILFIIGCFLLFGTKTGKQLFNRFKNFIIKSSLKIILLLLSISIIIDIAAFLLYWIICNPTQAITIVVFAFLIFIAIGFYQEKKEKEEHARILEEWENKTSKCFTDIEIEKMISPLSESLYSSDSNSVKFKSEFPFGRITYFINFFEHDLQFEEPIYFSPIRSRDKDELREYGTVLTTAGLYISNQLDRTDKNNKLISKDIFIPFSGMIMSRLTSNSITVYYTNYNDKIRIEQKYTTVSLAEINKIFDIIISSGISKAIFEEDVYDYSAIADEQEANFYKQNFASNYANGFVSAGVASSSQNMNQVFNDIGNNMNQRQGHGTAAEYANTAFDRMRGFKAEHIGGSNEKNGADRTVGGFFNQKEFIQCKYCKTAADTINDAFNKHNYPTDMKIEVPRDQYQKCVDILQKKIDNGDLESKGIHKGERAEKYLRKGYVTYNQALNITKAGSIDGLVIDAMQGIVCSVGSGSITAIITFAFCKWNGMNTKEAAQNSILTFAKVVGKSTAVFMITMQLSRKKVINIFSSTKNSSFNNPFYSASEKLANKISNSNFAKSKIGTKIGLNNIKGKAVISGAVTAAVTFGPDICRALVGRISFKQLMKNSAIGASGIAGAAIGQTVIPIPIVGAMIGGSFASFVAKKALDHFVEDDAIEMFAILKEEFIDIIPMSGLNESEFNEVVNMTLAHKKLDRVLRDMYAYGDSREYAREYIISKAVQYIYMMREQITEATYIHSIGEYISE